MITKYRIFLGILALALAVGLVNFWPIANESLATGTAAVVAVPAGGTPARISIWEVHNLAHLENLPVQHLEDQSLVFHQVQR
jgi:hypothetical protein